MSRVRAGGQIDSAALLGHALQPIVVDQQLVIEVDPRAVVRGDEERVLARFRNLNHAGESQSERVGLLLLRDVHHDLRHDAAGFRLELGERFNGDVRWVRMEVIDLNAALQQRGSARFRLKIRRQFKHQRADGVVQAAAQLLVRDRRHRGEQVAQAFLALRGGKERRIARAVGRDPGNIAELPNPGRFRLGREVFNPRRVPSSDRPAGCSPSSCPSPPRASAWLFASRSSMSARSTGSELAFRNSARPLSDSRSASAEAFGRFRIASYTASVRGSLSRSSTLAFRKRVDLSRFRQRLSGGDRLLHELVDVDLAAGVVQDRVQFRIGRSRGHFEDRFGSGESFERDGRLDRFGPHERRVVASTQPAASAPNR